MVSKRRMRIQIDDRDGYEVVDLGNIEIWDGADLCLIRDSLVELIDDGAERIGVDMTAVKYIPSGFFGMLYDWQEKGIELRLYHPQPNVANMLWFRKFFDSIGDGTYRMLAEGKDLPGPAIRNPKWVRPSWGSDSATAVGSAHAVASNHR